MNIRQSSCESLVDVVSSHRIQSLLAAALALGIVACSVDDRAVAVSEPSSPSPATEPNEPSTPDDSPSAGVPSEPETGSMAASPSEGQQVTDRVAPEEEPSSGGPTPTTPAPGEEVAGNTDVPAAGGPGAAPAVPSDGCGQARTLQDGTQTIASGGMNRTYFLETPGSYDNTHPHRVVFMFHWNYGSINAIVNPPDADQNTDLPFYGMGELTDDETIFVVPQGLANAGGGAGWPNPNNRDVNFTDDMLAAISTDLCIDTSRVFTTGFSFGAGMSVALACVRPDKFRAAVVYAPAFISGVQPAQCTTPIPFFESHGVDDQVINYSTGLNVLNTFTALNGCTAMTPPDPPADGHSCVSYEGCSFPTRFCNFGAGAGNPFNTSLRGHYPTSKDAGQSTSWVPAEAWSFITQF
jgi:poly(3-hydroxybutyrate) depolymerase